MVDSNLKMIELKMIYQINKRLVFLQLIFILFLFSGDLFAQLGKPLLQDSLFSTHYHQRASHFRTLPFTDNDIIFLGNSITDGAGWSELFDDNSVKNRGISGDISAGVIHRIDEVTDRKPAKVFLLIGVNDLSRNIAPDSVLKNILWIASYIRQETPLTQVYVQSILPVNDAFGKFGGHTSKVAEIKQVNAQLQQNASAYHYTYIDLSTAFSNEDGKLEKRFTNDGLHLTGEAYLLWKHLLYPHVFDLQVKPSLIPSPQKVKWGSGYFPLYACKTIVVNDAALQKEAERLQQILLETGVRVEIRNAAAANEPFIALRKNKVEAPQFQDEAYHLKVDTSKVIITGNTDHGIFNGIQTLDQLMRDGTILDVCEITDWPAFSWRGYMVDVGRNYQSMPLLKQQIDMMAKYKMNIFHFHFTEDIAWRLEVPQYPELTAPEHMQRNKGAYYSVEELKELIQYCKERYITLVPEIDMPGHSAAFTRAMGVDMQSKEGLAILKNILTDFCKTYDVPYVHIGGDEVKITNPDFLPTVTQWLHDMGKQTIGWDPGGNLDKETIRQLWMKEGPVNEAYKYIDSRHLYLNHMDPLESVATIFNRRIGNRDKADANVLGGTVCLWHDRNVLKQEDLLLMNPVYPGLLAFAERSWKGGDYEGWIANIEPDNTPQLKDFQEFEGRLLDHKKLNFTNLPFPYVAQMNMKWKLFGPYDNKGDVSQSFAPEKEGFKPEGALEAVGGTIVLRHFWHPLVSSILEDPKENTTWYATTKIWIDVDTVKHFWIGFNNLSRSYNSDTPAEGTWDDRGSTLFFNGRVIAPPAWKRAGQQGNSEIPLIDEGYEYRPPVAVPVQKGWNIVLVKLPVGSFKGKNWQNPVKWMFTFVPVASSVK